ncbi:MAG: hypothetical protein R3F11_02625 [Verrucomicrobiales bacterium]
MSTKTPVANPHNDEGNIQDAVIRLAGNSQDGIQTIGGMLARLAGRTAQEVMTYMTIPSTISGRALDLPGPHRLGRSLVPRRRGGFSVAFYQHSFDSHVSALREGGVCLAIPTLSNPMYGRQAVHLRGRTDHEHDGQALGGTIKAGAKTCSSSG